MTTPAAAPVPPAGAGAQSPSALPPAGSSRADRTAPPPRSLAPDIARGLMLALIAVANVSWFLWGHGGTVGMTPHVPARSAGDTVVQAVMTLAVDHRAMPLFAFLFGYGMVQFTRSRLARGIEEPVVRRMLRRRHWAMLLLGLLHAALLFYGDILGAYAIAGLLLVWLFFSRRTRTLVVWASVIGGITVLFGLVSVLGGAMTLAFAPPEVLEEMASGNGAAYSMAWVRDLAYGGAYLPGMANRALLWLVSTVPFALFVAPLPILLGWIAARHRLLDEPWDHRRTLRRLAVGGIAIGWLTALPDALAILGVLPIPDAVSWMFSGLSAAGGVACGVGYAAAFGLLAARVEGRPTGLARVLAAVGQRSLTFYLFQSLLLAPLMAGWGLGLGPQLSTAPAVAIAFGVWLLSLPLAAWLENRSVRGPAELLLRRMTYGRLDPARRA